MHIAQDPSVLHLRLASDSAAGGLPPSCTSLGGAAGIGNFLVKPLATVKGMAIKLKALLQQQVVVLVVLTSPAPLKTCAASFWNGQVACAMQAAGNMGKRQANMWGAVPPHHHAVPAAQAHPHPHPQAQAQAQAHQFVLAQAHAQAAAQAHAQAQAQAMRHVPEPPPPPPTQMGGFPHSG